MAESIDQLDKSIFLALNGSHHPWIDVVMWYSSQMLIWLPVYVLLLYSIFKKYGSRNFLFAILSIALLLFITDFVAVHSIKNTVMRLRPGHDPDLMGRVLFVKDANGNDYRGGRYGFFSNHASNYSGIVTFYLLAMKPVRRLVFFLLMCWLLLIVYSRIYLGVHYPLDVLAGMVYGTITGWLIWKLFIVSIRTKSSHT